MKKRLSALLLALVWAISLSACGAPAAGPPSSPLVSLPVASDPASSAPVPSDPAPPGPSSSEQVSSEPVQDGPAETEQSQEGQNPSPAVAEDGWYSSKDEVALYIHLYGHLPDNYVSKREAQDLGWTGGSVEPYTGEGTAIGGSRFGNYEGLLPEADGRTYTECDIDTVGRSSRGSRRVVFSNDGLIYYTGDHYESFELLYGEP